MKWQQDGTYYNIIQQYIHYIRKHYGMNVVVVFDGYGNGPSTKDHEHERKAKKSSPIVIFDETKPVHRNQNDFPNNEINKKSFVWLLSQHLQHSGFKADQARDDADTLIVKTALQIATAKESVTVIADDTDILVMLVHHFKTDMADIYMQSEITRHSTVRKQVTPIRAVW